MRRRAGLVPLLLPWLMAALALWVPVHRAASHFSFNYNEGWNAYRADAVLGGRGVYRSPPGYTAANYPPVWFHLPAAAKGVFGGVNAAGRCMAVAAPLVVLAVSALAPQYSAMNDPQMLAHALILAGVALYLYSAESVGWMATSAVLGCLGLFVKQTLGAFPAVVFLHLLWANRRRALVWISTAVATAVLITAWILAHDGGYFFAHLWGPRAYSATAAAGGLLACLYLCGLVTLAGLFEALRRAGRDGRHLLVPMLVFGLAEALVVGVASGVASNVVFDAVFAPCILAGVAPVLLGVGFLPAGHPVLHGGAARKIESFALAGRDYAADLAYWRDVPGPALCEDLLLCYEAGKPLLYEPFSASEYIRAGRLSAQPILDDLRAHRLSVVALARPASDRFPPQVLAAAHLHYRLARTSAARVFLVR